MRAAGKSLHHAVKNTAFDHATNHELADLLADHGVVESDLEAAAAAGGPFREGRANLLQLLAWLLIERRQSAV